MKSQNIKKRIRQWFFRKVDEILRSNSHHRFIKTVTILTCLIVSAILALLIFLQSS